MASQKSTADFILEQLKGAGPVSARKMFGEYGIYCDGKTVALLCDDQLFVKPTLAGQNFLGTVTEGTPFPGAKAWFLITGDRWDDQEWLVKLIKLTADELPIPVKKPRKRKG